MDSLLQNICDFADKAHGNQMRKYTPERYIVHPVRVMQLCSKYTNSTPMLAAALLHDVLEDTTVTENEIADYLKLLLPDADVLQTINLVVELTDVYTKEAYPQWNRRKRKELENERLSKTSADAQTIKYADIIDNCREIVKFDKQFGPKFLKECMQLLKVINKGNADLYRLAQKAVNK